MVVDPGTGTFRLRGGLCIGGDLSRSAFLASEEGRSAKIHIQNEPWCSFALWNVDGEPVLASLWFHGETLLYVKWMLLGEEFGTSWEDCTEEKGQLCRKMTEEWMAGYGVHVGKRYPWGRVESFYDGIHTCEGFVRITYSEPPLPVIRALPFTDEEIHSRFARFYRKPTMTKRIIKAISRIGYILPFASAGRKGP